MAIFGKQEKLEKFTSYDKRLILAVFCLITILFLPALLNGVKISHDIRFHLSWFLGFKDQIYNGVLYPRWLPTQFNGLGAPVFFFYPPFTSYFFTLLDGLFFYTLPADRVFGVGAYLLSLFSGLSFFTWAKNFAGQKTAIIASTFYAVAPYHLAIDYYNRGAMAEYAAYIWIPLIFAGAYHTIRTPSPKWFSILALSATGLLFTHLLTALVIAPFAALYCLILIFQNKHSVAQNTKTLSLLALAGVIGAGLAAVYILPALTLMDFINTDSLHKFRLEDSFIQKSLTVPSGKDRFLLKVFSSATVYIVLTSGLICVLAFQKIRKISLSPVLIQAAYWLGAATFCYLLMSGYMSFIMREPSPYREVQFTWRFMTAMEFAVISASVMMLGHLTSKRNFQATLILCILAVSPLMVYQAVDIVNKTRDAYYSKSLMTWDIINTEMSPEEYLPNGTAVPKGKALFPYVMELSERPVPAEIISGKGKIKSAERQSSNFTINVTASTPVTIALHQFYFTGWEAVDEKGNVIETFPETPDKLVTFKIPEGKHLITVSRKILSQERNGWKISGFSLILWLGFMLIWTLLIRKKNA